MQNKGLIRFLAWAFALVCLFQLSFTVVTNSIQHKAKKTAETYINTDQAKQLVANRTDDAFEAEVVTDSLRNAYEAHYLDSMATEKVYLGFTYRECQAREINLGLDLKGGMNVMLEVSTVDVVRALADNTDDTLFNRAIDMALENQKRTTNRDFVTLFYNAIRELDPGVSLASYFGSQLRDQIKLSTTNDSVINIVREKASESYENTYQVLSRRIDKFGVAQPTIQKLPASERILVELPGVKDPERVRKLLQGTAQLEFWVCHDNTEVMRYLLDANNYLASINSNDVETETEEVEPVEEAKDSVEAMLEQLTADNNGTTAARSSDREAFAKNNPLLAKLQLYVDASGQAVAGPVVGLAAGRDRAAIDEMLAKAAAKKLYDTRSLKFLWSAKPDNHYSGDVYALYAIKITSRDGSAPLGGNCISDARHGYDVGGESRLDLDVISIPQDIRQFVTRKVSLRFQDEL